MMQSTGPGVGETRRSGWWAHGAGWRATVVANHLPPECGGARGCFQCSNVYFMDKSVTQHPEYKNPFIAGNHEFGHAAHWWLNDMAWANCPPAGGTPFREGWADGFLAAVSHFAPVGGVEPGTAGYNGDRSIEVIETAKLLFDNRLHLAGAMLDFWDEAITETHPNGIFTDTTHVFTDTATGIWHDAWEMTDEVTTTDTICQFRNTWVDQGRPVSGTAAMDHAKLCP